MTDKTSLLRDRTNHLALRLATTLGADIEQHQGAMRHLAVAALNLLTETDQATLNSASKALPWLAIFTFWEDDRATADAVAARIERQGLIRHLGAATIRRQLESAAGCEQSNIRRRPEIQPWRDRADALATLVERDLAMEQLLATEQGERADLLIADSALLATALNACNDPGHKEIAHALEELVPSWKLHSNRDALEMLAEFEAADFEAAPGAFEHLGQRARRFEKSLADHLRSHDLLPALRIALAISPREDQQAPRREEIRRYLARFSVFAADPTLRELALALIITRKRIPGYLRGELPLGALDPWVEYLRGPCAEFAEARGITLREATNFAHYALHLLDLFDLAATKDAVMSDSLRRALMDVEEELKEFALVGQRAGLSDAQSNLARFDANRWHSEGLLARLADRLSRLCGAWRSGHRASPPGSPPVPKDELFDQCLKLVTDDREDSRFDALANLMGQVRFTGLRELSRWTPEDLLTLFAPVLRAAIDASTVDVNRGFVVDFSALTSWLVADSGGGRTDVLHRLLECHTPDVKILTGRTGLVV